MIKTNQGRNRREFLISGAAAAAGVGCLGIFSKANINVLMQPPVKDSAGTHNMMLVGEQSAYLSHLPMFVGLNETRTDFSTRHRYQVILEATFTDGARNLTDDYFADRKKNPDKKMYTLNPSLFVLPDLDPAGRSPLRKFRGGGVFRGHLERDGEVLFGREHPPDEGLFDVNVVNVIHFHKFVPGTPRPAQLQYLLFGKGAETFMAHFIVAPPDFDQIISVRITPQQFTDAQLSHGIKVTLPGKANTALKRLREKEQASGTFVIPGTSIPRPLNVEAVREFYFEESELFMPPKQGPTREELKSGFPEPTPEPN